MTWWASGVARLAFGCCALLACAAPQPRNDAPDSRPRGDSGAAKVDGARAREVLAQFIAAAESGDFGAAYRLLSGELRARYTPARLEADFKAEPLATERLARAREALRQEPVIDERGVRFSIGDEKAVHLVIEDGEYRIAALE